MTVGFYHIIWKQSYDNIKKELNLLRSFFIGQVTDALCYVTSVFIYALSPVFIPSICSF